VAPASPAPTTRTTSDIITILCVDVAARLCFNADSACRLDNLDDRGETVYGSIFPEPAFDDRTTMAGRCAAGFLVDVELVAADPAAHRARYSTTLRCQ
jgi:hypothetical protein